jgi:hypothetical protein
MVSSSHLKIYVPERHASITFDVLVEESPTETLPMLEESYKKAAMKGTQVCHKRFRGGRSADDCQLRQMTKAWSVCAML